LREEGTSAIMWRWDRPTRRGDQASETNGAKFQTLGYGSSSCSSFQMWSSESQNSTNTRDFPTMKLLLPRTLELPGVPVGLLSVLHPEVLKIFHLKV
jgi:hypothetical protein